MSEFRKLKKIELHRHLDGSVRLETLRDLCLEAKIDLGFDPQDLKKLKDRAMVVKPLSSLQEVLDAFEVIQKAQYSYKAIERVTRENLEDLDADCVELGELRFAPAFLADGKNLDVEKIVETVVEAVATSTAQVNAGLILIAPRSLPLEASEKALNKFLELRNSSDLLKQICVGFDLADMEDRTKKTDFIGIVESARAGGLGITVHSGEDTTAEDVAETIKVLGPSRIGHGIQSIRSQEVIDLLIEKDIHLEVCPTSNWLTQSSATLEGHPLPLLYKKGVSVGLNSDDPNLMGIDLTHEYEVCHKHYGFGEDEFNKMYENALRASFLNQN